MDPRHSRNDAILHPFVLLPGTLTEVAGGLDPPPSRDCENGRFTLPASAQPDYDGFVEDVRGTFHYYAFIGGRLTFKALPLRWKRGRVRASVFGHSRLTMCNGLFPCL